MVTADPEGSELSFPLFGNTSFQAAALDALSESVVACTPEGQIVYGNREAREATGYDAGELASMSITDLLPDATEPAGYETLREAVEQGTDPVEVTLHTKSGRVIPCVFEGSRVEHADETVLCGVLRDVSDRTRREADVGESEHKYRRLFEESQEGITITSPAGEIIDANPAACTLNGYTREELLGMNASELYADSAERENLVQTLQEEGEIRGMELSLHRKDGDEIVCQVSATVWRDEDGEVEAIQAYTRDITERRRREEQFRLLVHEVKEYAIFRLDSEGHVTTWNEGAKRIKGYTGDEIIGSHFSTFYTAEDIEAGTPSRALKIAAQEGQWTTEGWRVRKDGSRFWANVTVTALLTDDGAVRGFAKVTRDMTERHRWEVELEEQKQRAEKAKQRATQENTLLRLTQTVAAMANDADSLEQATQHTIDIICEHIEWPAGHVHWIRRCDGEPYLESSRIWGFEEGDRLETLRSVTEDTDFALDDSLPGRAATRGTPVWIRDITEDPTFVRSKSAEDIGVKGAFAFPILLDGDAVAVLEFFSEDEEEPDEKVMDAMGSVGLQLSRVAERERAQKKLRRSEKRYRRLFETSQEGIAIQGADRTVTDVNSAALDILGYDREDLIGRTPNFLFADADQRRRLRQRIEEQGHLDTIELALRRADGEVIVCEATSTLQLDTEDDPEAFYTIFRDITERKRAQEALRTSEERYRSLTESAVEAIIIAESAGHIIDWNSGAGDIFGYEREEALGQPLEILIPERHRSDHRKGMERATKTGEGPLLGTTVEMSGLRKQGDEFPIELSLSTWQANGDRHFAAIIRDISQRRRLQEELVQVLDEERQRLSRELHDGVSSMLTAVGIQTSTLAAERRAGEQIAPEELDEVTEYVQQAAEEARAISHGLSPVGLEGGLSSALEELVSRAEVDGELACSFDATGTVPELSEETEIHLYRIAQEAVNNAVKHAKADHIGVRLAANDEEGLTLTVQDDGQGHPGSLLGDEGLGLRTMRYRAELIDGSLTVEESPDGGVLVQCQLSSLVRS